MVLYKRIVIKICFASIVMFAFTTKAMNNENTYCSILFKQFYEFLTALAGCNDPLYKKFIQAIENNDIKAVTHCIKMGVSLHGIDKYGRNPFWHAAANNCSPAIIELLITHGAISREDPESLTPLLLAIKNGNIAVVKILIKNISPVNARNKEGVTPLIYAIVFGETEIVEFLLNNNADPLLCDGSGTCPFVYSLCIRPEDISHKITNILLKHDFSEESLYRFFFKNEEMHKALKAFEESDHKSSLLLKNKNNTLYQEVIIGRFINYAFKDKNNSKQELSKIFVENKESELKSLLNNHETLLLAKLKEEYEQKLAFLHFQEHFDINFNYYQKNSYKDFVI